jgi:hypothetical protein
MSQVSNEDYEGEDQQPQQRMGRDFFENIAAQYSHKYLPGRNLGMKWNPGCRPAFMLTHRFQRRKGTVP